MVGRTRLRRPRARRRPERTTRRRGNRVTAAPPHARAPPPPGRPAPREEGDPRRNRAGHHQAARFAPGAPEKFHKEADARYAKALAAADVERRSTNAAATGSEDRAGGSEGAAEGGEA